MKTCVISFSSRADGNCAAIADCVQETLGAEGLTRFDFSGLSVHGCGACHCECFRQREACPYFADDAFRLNEAAALADRYLAVPKKFIVVSNTGRENFLAAFRDHVLPGTEPDVCFLRAAAYHRISLDGDLMTCEPARAAVREFLRDW